VRAPQSCVIGLLGIAKLEIQTLSLPSTTTAQGPLGRKLELLVLDDATNPATAVRLYENLITRDKTDLVLGPVPADTSDAVANRG